MPDGIEAQTAQAIDNIRVVLEAAGATLGDAVKVTAHPSDLADFAAYDAVYRGIFAEPRPVRTMVGSTLIGIAVEIDAVEYVRTRGRVVKGIHLDKVHKSYGASVRAVNGVTLDVQPGEFIVLVGPCGCGKSTTATNDRRTGRRFTSGSISVGDQRSSPSRPATTATSPWCFRTMPYTRT